MPSSNSAKKKCVSVTWCRKFYETLLKYGKNVHKWKNNGT